MLKKHDKKYEKIMKKKESLKGFWIQYNSIQNDNSNLVKIQRGNIIWSV